MSERMFDDRAWGDSEMQLRRLRDWLINYEGIYPETAAGTVDLFTARYMDLRKALVDSRIRVILPSGEVT